MAAFVVVGLAVLMFGASRWRAGQPRFRVDPGSITVDAMPAWADGELAVTIARRLGAALGPPASLARSEDIDRWARVLDGDPWVERVVEARGQFPYRASMALVLRRPVMSVDGILWSADGWALGEGGTTVEPVPLTYEGPLTDGALLECAAACDEIRTARNDLLRDGLRLERVGVSDGGYVVFGCEGGAQIVWGRSTRYHEMAQHDWPVEGRIDHIREAVLLDPGLANTARIDVYLDRLRIVPAPTEEARGGR